MNRQDMISQTLLWESVAAKAKAKAAIIRDQLAEDARAELKEQGTAPTWRLPEVGVVTLPVSQESVYVRDADALLQWVAEFYPSELETVTRVRPGFVGELLPECRSTEDGDAVVWMREGQLVRGLGVRPGGQPLALSFRPSREAKQFAGAYADRLIGELEQQLSPELRRRADEADR